MKISVVIPTFNREELILRALESVFNQTRPADEVIVVDDGSTDQTKKSVTEKYPGIIYLSQDHQGVSAARNQGIRCAQGDWIAFLDSDDVWRPQKLEKQVEAVQNSPQDRFCHTDEIWVRRGRRVNPKKKHTKKGGRIFLDCLPLCCISPSSVLMRKDLFDEMGLFDESLPACEDYDLWLRICAKYSVLFVSEPLVVKYGGHFDQLSQTTENLDIFRIQALEKILNSKDISDQERGAVIKILCQKIDIYAQGAKKREKFHEAQIYQKKLEAYQEVSAS